MGDSIEEKNQNINPVLRVTQLDTQELDESLLLNLKQSINQDFFKYIQYDFFQKYHVEIFTAVKFVLWYNTYYKNSHTVGQSILDWKYNKNSLFKKCLHGAIYCLDEWVEEKFPILFQRFCPNERVLNLLRIFLKTSSFLNYLVFLFDGKYLHLWERILRLRPVYNKEQYMRNFNHEVSQREELWQTYFSIFKLIDSLISFKNLLTKVKKAYLIKIRPKNHLENSINLSLCAICQNEPTMVHCSVNANTLDGCKHVFCYFCIKKALTDNDNKFQCRICNNFIYDIEFLLINLI